MTERAISSASLISHNAGPWGQVALQGRGSLPEITPYAALVNFLSKPSGLNFPLISKSPRDSWWVLHSRKWFSASSIREVFFFWNSYSGRPSRSAVKILTICHHVIASSSFFAKISLMLWVHSCWGPMFFALVLQNILVPPNGRTSLISRTLAVYSFQGTTDSFHPYCAPAMSREYVSPFFIVTRMMVWT